MAAAGDPRAYYRALGVARTASADDIKAAFRERAKQLHPDRGGDGERRAAAAGARGLPDACATRSCGCATTPKAGSERGGTADPGADAPEPPGRDVTAILRPLTRRWLGRPDVARQGGARAGVGTQPRVRGCRLASGGRARPRDRERSRFARRTPKRRPPSLPAADPGRAELPRVYRSAFRFPDGAADIDPPTQARLRRHRRRSAPRHRGPAGAERMDGRGRGRDRARGRRARAADRCLGACPAPGRRRDPVPGRPRHSGGAGGRAVPSRRPVRPTAARRGRGGGDRPRVLRADGRPARPGCRSGSGSRRAPARSAMRSSAPRRWLRVGAAASETRSACGALPRPMKNRSAGVDQDAGARERQRRLGAGPARGQVQPHMQREGLGLRARGRRAVRAAMSWRSLHLRRAAGPAHRPATRTLWARANSSPLKGAWPKESSRWAAISGRTRLLGPCTMPSRRPGARNFETLVR